METNAVIQMALLAVLPFVMQGIKQIAWVEKQKAWVCPLICIIISVVAAYLLKLPSWLVVGILTGAATNKVYDWVHDAGKPAVMILFLLVPSMIFFGGCGKLVKWDAAVDKHVRATQTDNVRHWQKCWAGDSNECATCLAVTRSEMQFIRDANSVKMDADFKQRFNLMAAQLENLSGRCSGGDPKACYDGARIGINYIGVVLAAVDDVNANPRKY